MPQFKAKILLIEDRENFRKVYHDIFTRDGYQVLGAKDGLEGLEMLKSERPDLVLLDLKIPKMSGFEVLEKMKEDPQTKNIPVIIFSVLGQELDVRKGLELGAVDYMIKGFYSPREIGSKIRSVLAQQAIQRAANKYNLSIIPTRKDAAKLAQDFGFTKMYRCVKCDENMVLEVIPDYAHTEGHWFNAHFVCPKCKRGF